MRINFNLRIGKIIKTKTTLIIVLLILFSCRAFGQKNQGDSQLPVIVLPAVPDENTPMVLMITGDGGWKNFDPKLAQQFVNEKVPVVALNALHYFWDKKTPAQTTADVDNLLKKYMAVWKKNTFILVGYSFGADVIPFIVNLLPKDMMGACAGIALFSPGRSTDFEIHLSQMMSSHRQWKYDVVKALEVMKPVKMVCFFGEKEDDFPVSVLTKNNRKVIYLHGGHHYVDNRDNLAKMVLKELQVNG